MTNEATPGRSGSVTVRPAAWTARSWLRNRDGGHFVPERRHAFDVPLYDQAALDAAVAAERERCASWVDARRNSFVQDHGSTDPDTGSMEFGRGAHAEAKAEYVGELEEISAGLRALPGA